MQIVLLWAANILFGLKKLKNMIDKGCFIHPSAIVDDGATIGGGTKIWHFSHIMGTAQIGDGCTIGQNVYVDARVTIGNRVKIQNNVSVYQGVAVEDDVFIGPSAVFTNVINPRSFVERKQEFKPTYIKKGASIGANTTIVCGIELGEYCFIGAGTVVLKNVKPFAIMVGNPAKQIGWISKTGIKLLFNEFDETFCKEENCIYYLKNNNVNFYDSIDKNN